MPCKCSPALLQLKKEINTRWPDRDKASDGCCGDPAHQARVSDHNPDASGYAHAHDFDEDLSSSIHSVGFLVPILLGDPRTKYVIYERLIYRPPSTIGKPYSGINPHDKHLHLSILPGATFDTRRWLAALDPPPTPTPTPPPPLGDDVISKEAIELVEYAFNTYPANKRNPDKGALNHYATRIAEAERAGNPVDAVTVYAEMVGALDTEP